MSRSKVSESESVIKVDAEIPNRLPRIQYAFPAPPEMDLQLPNPQNIAEKYYEASKAAEIQSRWALLHEALRMESTGKWENSPKLAPSNSWENPRDGEVFVYRDALTGEKRCLSMMM
jgi:hypothetical protein